MIERSACPTCGSCSGMFTANSMNCLIEALGLALPGNGTVLATHADRQRSVRRGRTPDRRSRPPPLRGGRRLRSAARDRQLRGVRERDDARHRHGRLDQHGAAPAGRGARGRGGLHHGATSTGCRAACPSSARSPPPSPDVHVEDVHRAGGIMAILGELDRAGLIDTQCPDRAHAHARRGARTLGRAADRQPHGARVLPRCPGRRADDGGVQPVRAVGNAGPRPRARRHPRRRARLLARMAAWPCCTATSPRMAAS